MADERYEEPEEQATEPEAEAPAGDVQDEPDFELHGQFFDAPSE